MNAETNSLQMIVAANDNPGFVVISISTHCITWIRRILLPMECIGCPIDKGFAYI
jgi:hypothetical protein